MGGPLCLWGVSTGFFTFMSQPSPSFYRPDIDGLRGLAVLMVVLFHAGLGFKGGYVGVDLFFVISGYLITGLLFKELDRGGIDLAGFWERRLRRIAPALGVMLLVTLAVGYVLLFPDAFISLGESAIAQALLCANLYFWQDSGYFAAASDEKPLLHLWSLAVEEQFYVLLPVVLILAHRWLKKRGLNRPIQPVLVKGLSWLLLFSFVASVIGVKLDANAAFYWLPTRAWELLVGSVLAGLPISWRLKNKRQREMVGAASLIMILIAALAYESDTPFPGLAALLPCLGAAGLIWAHTLRAGETTQPQTWRLMTWKPLVATGLISYSLYLWHWPLLAFAQYLTVSGESRPPLSVRLILILTALILAWISWRWVETPFRQKTILKTRRSVFVMGMVTSFLFIGLGLTMIKFQGLPDRMPEAALKYAQGSQDKDDSFTWTGLEAASQGQFPHMGSSETPVRLMLWGDSHARSLLPAMEALCQEHGVSGEAAIFSATAPTVGFYRRSRHGLNERTEELAQAVLKRVKEKAIPYVVLTAYWMECPGQETEKFGDALIETVRLLKAAGAEVWLVLDVPTQPFNVPKALALGQLPGGFLPDPTSASTSLEQHQKSNAVMLALLPGLQAAGAKILDPATMMQIPGDKTMIEMDGHSLYSDSHHLSITGALRLKPLFAPLFP